jgi:hypothetical protein
MGTNNVGAGSHAAIPIDLDKAMVVVGEVQAAKNGRPVVVLVRI